MNKVSIIALKNGYVIGHADHLYQDHSVAKTLDEVCEIVRSHFEPEDEPQFSKPEGPGWMPFSENKPNWLRDNQVMQAAFPSGNMWTYYAAAQKLLGVDVSWVRVAPPERPEGFIEYDFNGQPVADDVEVKLLFWDGYISPKRKAKDAIWPTFEKTDELLTSDNWEQARFAYCVIEETDTEEQEDTSSDTNVAEAEAENEPETETSEWAWDPYNGWMVKSGVIEEEQSG